MADRCKNCGAELFTAQRFCRACGASTNETESAPTQIMPPPPPDLWGSQGAPTAPTRRAETDPVFTPPAYYQPTVPPPLPAPSQPRQPYEPPKERSRSWVPIVVLIAVLFFGGAIYGGRFIVRKIRDAIAEVSRGVKSSEVVDSRTLDLAKGAPVSVSTLNGSITIESWDRPQADIIITKRGPNADVLRDLPVKVEAGQNGLVIEEPQVPNNVSVSFMIRVPRELGAVKIRSTNGGINISGVSGVIDLETTNGPVRLADVSGLARARTTNGGINGEINGFAADTPVEISSTNGGITLELQGDINAELAASTTHGAIRIDQDEFPGVSLIKERVGQQATGRIGNGGQPLKISTTNGSIRINR